MTDGGMTGSHEAGGGRSAAHKLGAIAWALFFIWIGIALLAGISLGISLLVIGVITLLVQVLRRASALPIEVIWVIVGCLFILGGILHILGVSLPLLPILILVAGVVLLISAITGRHSARQ